MGREQRGKGTRGSSWWCIHLSAETDSNVKDSGGLVVSSLLLLALLKFSWLVFHGSTWFFIRTSYCESALRIRLEKSLMKGKIAGKRRRGQQRVRWLDGITDSRGLSLSKLREPGVLQFMGSQRVGHDLATEQQQTCCETTQRLLLCLAMAGSFGQ